MSQTPSSVTQHKTSPIFTRLLMAFLSLLIVFGSAPLLSAQAVTQKDIQGLKDKQSQIASSKSELQAKITAIKNDKSQAVAKKALIEEQIEVIRQELEVTNALIAELDLQITEKTIELEEALAEEAEYNARFLKRVRNMEEQGSVSYVSVLFNSASFSDLLDNMNVISEIVEYDHRVMDKLEQIRVAIAEVKEALETARSEQEAAKAQLERSKAELEQQQREVEALVAQIKAAEAEYAEQLDDMERNASSIAAEIQAAEAKYAAQLASQQGNATLSGTGGFVWPLPGYGKSSITSPYGWRVHPVRGGQSFHGGTDIAARAGTPIIAAKGGTVIISTYHGSYGNYVVIAHPDGSRTLYAHMSSRAVSVGQTVNQSQTIGYVGTTGSSTGNHLHFEVWKGSNSSTRTNPMSFF